MTTIDELWLCFSKNFSMLSIDIQQNLGAFSLDIQAEIPSKGVTAIWGKSGAGKSSLINLIAGLSLPQKGAISINEHILFDSSQRINLAPEKRNVGYVFQEPRLFPHYTVEKNLKYGCKRFDLTKFLQIVNLLGIGHLLERFPNNLSGGEKQRVAIGRALLSEPDILLMDEPLSALDLSRKKELLDYLVILAQQLDIPILYVSHSLDEVVRLADNLLLLDEGKVVAFERTVVLWQSELFRQWLPNEDRSTLLELPVVSEYEDMQELAIGEQRLWLSRQSNIQIGNIRRIVLNGRDILLTLSAVQSFTNYNQLLGVICNILPKNDRLEVAVKVEGQQIWLDVSYRAFQTLQLSVAQQVYLYIRDV